MSNLIGILLVGAAIWGFLGFVSPTYDEIKTLKAERDEYEVALERARELDALRSQLVTKYNSVSEEDLARLSALLPDSVDNVRLIIDINQIAGNHGMFLQDIKVEGGKSDPEASKSDTVAPAPIGQQGGDPSSALSLSFTVDGTYEDFKAFILDLEKSLRIVDVTNISFAAGEGDFNSYSVKLRTYWLTK